MHERSQVIANTKYSFDEFVDVNGRSVLKKGTVDQLDKMITGTVKLYENLERIDNMLILEDIGDGKVLSESESGDI